MHNTLRELQNQKTLLDQMLKEYNLRINTMLADRIKRSNESLALNERISNPPMVVIALNELHIAHSLFRDEFVSTTVLDALAKGLHNSPLDQVWPMAYVPEGQFDGTLDGSIFDSVVDAAVDLKLTSCDVNGNLNGKQMTNSKFTGQLTGHFEGTLTGRVCGSLKGTMAMSCSNLHIRGCHIIRFGLGSGWGQSLSSILVAAIPQNITSVLAGTKTKLVQFSDLKTTAGKDDSAFIIIEFPSVEEPLEFIDSYINTAPLQPFKHLPLVHIIREMLRGRLRLTVAFIRMFYHECKVYEFTCFSSFTFYPYLILLLGCSKPKGSAALPAGAMAASI
jgi:hypothetical protein